MNKKHEIITSILNKNHDLSLSMAEIWADMEPAEQGQFKNKDDLSRELCTMRDRGLVANGDSEIVKGRTTLTWLPVIQANEMPSDVMDMTINTVFELDPSCALDKALISLKEIMVGISDSKKQSISNRDIKIKTLDHIASSPLIHQDIANVLYDIADDLEKLETA